MILPVKERTTEQQAIDSPPAPASASRASSSPVAVVAVMALAGESLGNGIEHQASQYARPQRIENQHGKGADEEPGSPVFRVEFRHLKLKDGGLL